MKSVLSDFSRGVILTSRGRLLLSGLVASWSFAEVDFVAWFWGVWVKISCWVKVNGDLLAPQLV